MVTLENTLKSFVVIFFLTVTIVLWGNRAWASPARPFWGVAYTPCHANQDDHSTTQLTDEQIKTDMPRLASLAGHLRTYSVGGAQADIPSIAAGYGLKTWVGGWIGRSVKENDTEMKRLVAASKLRGVEAVIVGNEVLLRHDQSPQEIIRYIQEVRKLVHVPVAYADSAYDLLTNAAVVNSADIILANIHPFWDGKTAKEGADHVYEGYLNLIKKYPGKTIVIGEVGWPSDGERQSIAQEDPTGTEERELIDGLLRIRNVHPEMRSFFFDAFDEPWKAGPRELGGEGPVGGHWGVFLADGSTKPALRGAIPDFDTEKNRFHDAGQVLDYGQLQPGIDLGVDTDQHCHDWLSVHDGLFDMTYPAGQSWGSVFCTSMAPVPAQSADLRGRRDFSRYDDLFVRIRALSADASVSVGVKSLWDPDNGLEPTVRLDDIPSDWKVFRIPLSSLCNDSYPRSRCAQLYVMPEFVFHGSDAVHIQVRDIWFGTESQAEGATKQTPAPPQESAGGAEMRLASDTPKSADPAVYVGGQIHSSYDFGYDTSEHIKEWVANKDSYMECSYPAGQSWGAVFFTTYPSSSIETNRNTGDFSGYANLSFDLRGAKGGETLRIGVKTEADKDDGREPTVRIRDITTEWKTYTVPLSDLVSGKDGYPSSRFSHLYVVFELVFNSAVSPETLDFRNVQFTK